MMNLQMLKCTIILLDVHILIMWAIYLHLLKTIGFAYMNILLDKIKINDIIGRVVIIHDMPDDFTTQPSGNSGTKIACGKIER